MEVVFAFLGKFNPVVVRAVLWKRRYILTLHIMAAMKIFAEQFKGLCYYRSLKNLFVDTVIAVVIY